MDYDIDELYERKVEENESYFFLFMRELEDEGLDVEEIKNHLANAELYVNDYLNFYEIRDMEEGLKCATDFFEDFLPNKCALNNPNGCMEMMDTLCKFYETMAKYGFVDSDMTEKFVNEIKTNQDKWVGLIKFIDEDSENTDN